MELGYLGPRQPNQRRWSKSTCWSGCTQLPREHVALYVRGWWAGPQFGVRGTILWLFGCGTCRSVPGRQIRGAAFES